MPSIITTNKKFMLYNKRQHLQHTVPRPLIIKPLGHALSNYEWEKFSKYIVPVKLHHFCERSGNGALMFFGESGVDAAMLLQQKFPERYHFVLECQDRNTAIIGLALAQELGLKISGLCYKETRNGIRNVNRPEILKSLAEEGKQILTEHNVKLA